MRIIAIVSTLLVAVSIPPAAAQILDCPDCVLGIYDDAARSSAMGTSTPGVVKSIYLGIDFGPGETGLTALELSIAGMRSDVDGVILISVEWIVPWDLQIGDPIVAPVDTSATSTGTGGVYVAWAQCLNGSRTLARLRFLHFQPLVNKVFQVKRKFPPSNSQYRGPIFVRCDAPRFTPVRVSGGCYILNWNGDPNAIACLDGPVGVEPRTWTGMKALFR